MGGRLVFWDMLHRAEERKCVGTCVCVQSRGKKAERRFMLLHTEKFETKRRKSVSIYDLLAHAAHTVTASNNGRC